MFVSQTCILMISYNNKYWVQQQFVYLCGHARYNIYSILTVFECVDVACSACFSKFPPKHVVVCGTKVPSQEELAKTVDLASHCVFTVVCNFLTLTVHSQWLIFQATQPAHSKVLSNLTVQTVSTDTLRSRPHNKGYICLRYQLCEGC